MSDCPFVVLSDILNGLSSCLTGATIILWGSAFENETPMTTSGQKQLAVRVDDETLQLIDKKRMQLAADSGVIPTRSDIVRVALEEYLKAVPQPVRRK